MRTTGQLPPLSPRPTDLLIEWRALWRAGRFVEACAKLDEYERLVEQPAHRPNNQPSTATKAARVEQGRMQV